MGHNDWLGVGHVLTLGATDWIRSRRTTWTERRGGEVPLQTMKEIDERQAKTTDVLYSLARAAITKYCKVDDLNDKNLLSHFWRLEVQNQGLNRGGNF